MTEEQMDRRDRGDDAMEGKEKNLVALAYYAGSWIFSRYLGRENCYPIITVTQQPQLNNDACFFL